MNLFNEINKNNSFSSPPVLRTCTSCCPFDAKSLPHPQLNYSSNLNNGITTTNLDACCLSKLQVDCRIKCRKKKKKKRYDSIYSSLNTKRSISSSSQLSNHRKRKKFGSGTNTNSHYDFDDNTETSSTLSTSSNSEVTQQSFSSGRQPAYHKSPAKNSNNQSRLHINEDIQNLKTSIDNLTQYMIHHQNPSISFIDKLRRLFSFSSKQSRELINEECCQILERNHLTKQNLISIYHLFDKNETIFLNWLRTIMPESFLPLLLNYVKYSDLISTDNK